MATFTFYAKRDTIIQHYRPDTPDGTANNLYIGVTDPATYWNKGLFDFDLSVLGPGVTFTDATFSLYSYKRAYSVASVPTYYIYRLIQTGWDETTATWNKYDGTNAWATAGCENDGVDYTSVNGASKVGCAVGWNNWTGIQNLIQDCYDNQNGHVQLVLAPIDNGGYEWNYFYSHRETTNFTLRPKLTVTCNVEPSTISTLSLLEATKPSTISLFADLSIAGRAILVSPPIDSKSKTSPITFTWKIPEDVSNRNVHCEIQVARDENFTDIEADLQSWRDDGFEYYDGTGWKKYPKGGVSALYYHNPARITIPLTEGLKYWRVRGGVYI